MQHVLTCADIPADSIQQLLQRYQLQLHQVPDQQVIPGSFWGDSEAGLIADKVYVRDDTPVHSLLHEACHVICMDHDRRKNLHTDVGGDYAEEDAVCYLQVILADYLPSMGRERMWQDMDQWGYSFRLGSTQRWFDDDAEDAKQWLQHYQLIDSQEQPTWQLRM